MHKIMLLPLSILLMAAAAPAADPALPDLEFSGFNAGTTLTSAGPDITCLQSIPGACKLKRNSLGGVFIENSMVRFNKDTSRIHSVTIWSERIFLDTAVDAFTAKYGKPTSDVTKNATNRTGGPYTQRYVSWTNFSSKDSISILAGEDDMAISVDWNQNYSKPAGPQLDF